ncbi:hypothetical protein E2C01_038961 [Portunus trituberculatus]|uniref:Uncharacterized protein n=1 Tax=Portunus trituberculatus TaxID=210409 RepID=A0A5B7FIJ8_PORTR|nr:hypothetical protein [Portunus trituberculatus]
MALLSAKCQELALKLNLDKTKAKAMAFGGGTREPFNAAGAEIAFVKQYQHLGVWLDPHLTLHSAHPYICS